MIRKLEYEDVTENYFRLLCQLSGEEKKDYIVAAFQFWDKYKDNDDHQIFIYEHEGKIIGTATVLVENKLLHYGSRVGHIEDVVVNKNKRLKGVGKELIERCLKFAQEKICYKIILDCSDDNVPFYESCGFKVSCNCMRGDL